MLKRYFWLAYLLLVTVAGVLAADMAREYAAMRLSAPAAQRSARAGAAGTPQAARLQLADYAVIAERNVFDASPPSPVEAPVQAPEVVQPTRLRLRLIGIVAGAAPGRQYAVIEDLQRGGSQDLYQIGDTVQKAAIVGIRPDCVLLSANRQHEKLCFDYNTAAEPNGAGAPRAGMRRDARGRTGSAAGEPSEDVVRVDEGTWRVRRDVITEQFADLGTLSRQVRVVPHTIQGRPSGFRLTRLRPGLLQRIGLVNGDVLQRVNGLNINSPEEALKAYQAVQSDSTVRLEILRRNSPTTLTYEIR